MKVKGKYYKLHPNYHYWSKFDTNRKVIETFNKKKRTQTLSNSKQTKEQSIKHNRTIRHERALHSQSAKPKHKHAYGSRHVDQQIAVIGRLNENGLFQNECFDPRAVRCELMIATRRGRLIKRSPSLVKRMSAFFDGHILYALECLWWGVCVGLIDWDTRETTPGRVVCPEVELREDLEITSGW